MKDNATKIFDSFLIGETIAQIFEPLLPLTLAPIKTLSQIILKANKNCCSLRQHIILIFFFLLIY